MSNLNSIKICRVVTYRHAQPVEQGWLGYLVVSRMFIYVNRIILFIEHSYTVNWLRHIVGIVVEVLIFFYRQ